MQNLQTFSFKENTLNTIQINGEPWFVANEVCSILSISNSRDAITRLDSDEKLTSVLPTSGQRRKTNLVNESGLYQLIFQSRKKEAKEFKRWVTHEVLPSIRKHGGYLTPEKTRELLMNPDVIIDLAYKLKAEQNTNMELMLEVSHKDEVLKLQEAQLTRQAPAVEYHDRVLNTQDTVTTNLIAKELGMSAIKLNQILHKDYRLIYKQGDVWHLYARFQDMNLTRTKTYTYTGTDGNERSSVSLVWTQKGRRFIHELFK